MWFLQIRSPTLKTIMKKIITTFMGVMISIFITGCTGTSSPGPLTEQFLAEAEEKKVKENIVSPNPEIKNETNPALIEDIMSRHSEEYEKVLEVFALDDLPGMQTETAAYADLKNRFGNIDFFSELTLDGEKENAGIRKASNEIHPIYVGQYKNSKGEIWNIRSIAGQITAEPFYYELDADIKNTIIYSENEKIYNYDNKTNSIYSGISKNTKTIVRVVDYIDSKFLNEHTSEKLAEIDGIDINKLNSHKQLLAENQEVNTEVTDSKELKYKNISEKIINNVPLSKCSNIESEAEAYEKFKSLGFEDVLFTSELTMDGEYDGSIISADSNEKHPLYCGYYGDSKGGLWQLYSLCGQITAEPLTYELNTNQTIQILLCETDEINSYDYDTKTVYTVVPKKKMIDVRVVEKLDAETLENFSFEAE